jgi:hypothetical protein
VALIEDGERPPEISALPIAPPAMQLNPTTDWMFTADPGKAGLGPGEFPTPSMGFAPENQVRTGLPAGGKEIRTLGPSRGQNAWGTPSGDPWLCGSIPRGTVAAVGVMSLIVCDQNLAAGLRHRAQPVLRMRRQFSVTSPDPGRAVSALLEGFHRC